MVGGLGHTGASGWVGGSDSTGFGVSGSPSVSLPDFPGSPPDFFLRFLVFLLFLFPLSWFFSRCPGSFPWISWFSSCFLPEVPDVSPASLPDCPGSTPDFFLKSWFFPCFLTGSHPVSFPDCLVALLIFLAPLLNFLV